MKENVFMSLLKSELRKLIANCDNKLFQELEKVLIDIKEAKEYYEPLFSLCSRRLAPMEKSVLEMSIFLWLFESFYVYRLDFVCLLLIGNGHDLYSRRQYVSSFQQVQKVDTYQKFEFLRQHKLEMLVRENDRELRNSIAHNRFKIDEKGSVSIQGKKVDMVSRIDDLMDFGNLVSKTFVECLGDIRIKQDD
jgi:hypothetical protein